MTATDLLTGGNKLEFNWFQPRQAAVDYDLIESA